MMLKWGDEEFEMVFMEEVKREPVYYSKDGKEILATKTTITFIELLRPDTPIVIEKEKP